jgi:hypothetical protein
MLQLKIRQTFGIFLLVISTLLMVSCSVTDDDIEETGELTLSLTDAEGDFNQYAVDVVSITLYRANGAVVETLPNTVTLDFSQYVEVTEFLSTATVPVGHYRKAEITLDYSNAEIQVEDSSGSSIPAQALDEFNNPLTSITVEMLFNEHTGFEITAGKPAALTIDFDLEASHEVTINEDSASVTVNPVMLASTRFEDEKTRRLRGILAGVSLDNESFGVNIRPFRIRHRDFGRIAAHTDIDTVFEIDGVAYSQIPGLEALAQLSGVTPLVAAGKVNVGDRRFLAQQVYAGSSVPWGEDDAVKGSIIARSGNVLTVIGATVEHDFGHFSYRDVIEVHVDSTTKVTKQGDRENGSSIDDLSVGQKITALGKLADDGESINTSNGIVRMRYSHVSGLVALVSPLELDLQHINRRAVSRFDFAGTGIDESNNADPDQYQIDSGLLSLNSLGMSEPVRVQGFPTAFGTAPLDFDAKTIIDLSELPTKMYLSYGSAGSTTAMTTLDENGMLLDLTSASGRHHLKTAGVVTDIAELASVPFIEPGAGEGLYAISRGHRVQAYLDWDRYQSALNDLLISGNIVVFVIADGHFDSVNLLLSARRVITRVTE